MAQRTAVVIGVGAEIGLGAALCRRFAHEGLHVLIAGRTPSKLSQLATSIGAAGGSAEPVPMDATNEADVVKLFDHAMAPANSREAPELIVYNAGGNQKADFRELSAELFERFWRVGCFGGFLVGREAAPAARSTRTRNCHLHGRIREPSGQARLRAVRRRQGRPTHGRPEHGA
jgi:NAD(P)-dependent dehydrogenase (short-subunit alcohol dehydrogenase family)